MVVVALYAHDCVCMPTFFIIEIIINYHNIYMCVCAQILSYPGSMTVEVQWYFLLWSKPFGFIQHHSVSPEIGVSTRRVYKDWPTHEPVRMSGRRAQ